MMRKSTQSVLFQSFGPSKVGKGKGHDRKDDDDIEIEALMECRMESVS